MSDYAQITNNRPAAADYGTRKSGAKTGAGFGDVLRTQEDKSAGQDRTGEEEKAAAGDYREQIREHMEEMLDRIRHGTIQPKIAIGAQEYTQEEWKKLLEKFDDAEETLQEQIAEEIEKLKEQAEKEQIEKEAAAEEELRSGKEKAVDSLPQYVL